LFPYEILDAADISEMFQMKKRNKHKYKIKISEFFVSKIVQILNDKPRKFITDL